MAVPEAAEAGAGLEVNDNNKRGRDAPLIFLEETTNLNETFVLKTCSRCGDKEPTARFHPRTEGGLRQPCIACVKASRAKECPSCGVLHSGNNRRSVYCSNCWPVHRQAVNLYGSAKYRSEQRDTKFNLSVQWIEERLRHPCPRTGLAFDILSKSYTGMGDRSPRSPSLDKINPALGYTTNNVQVVCWWYNAAKQQFTDEEVIELCKLVASRAS